MCCRANVCANRISKCERRVTAAASAAVHIALAHHSERPARCPLDGTRSVERGGNAGPPLRRLEAAGALPRPRRRDERRDCRHRHWGCWWRMHAAGVRMAALSGWDVARWTRRVE